MRLNSASWDFDDVRDVVEEPGGRGTSESWERCISHIVEYEVRSISVKQSSGHIGQLGNLTTCRRAYTTVSFSFQLPNFLSLVFLSPSYYSSALFLFLSLFIFLSVSVIDVVALPMWLVNIVTPLRRFVSQVLLKQMCTFEAMLGRPGSLFLFGRWAKVQEVPR
ncbi:hypothetical protein VTI74DRAFT_6874 [Chaetomium olivicolor]